jgi:hypothetical protein
MILVVAQLISGELDIHGLHGFKHAIAQYLLANVNVEQDERFSVIFKVNFMLVLSQMIYYLDKTYPEALPLSKSRVNVESTRQQQLLWIIKRYLMSSEEVHEMFLNNLFKIEKSEC